MSDSDLASALEIKNHLHRKKLRLAIEEQRNLTVGLENYFLSWLMISYKQVVMEMM